MPLVLVVALVAGACGGGTGGDLPTPVTTSASAGPPTPTAGAPAIVGTFRACHKLHDESLVLVLQFENHDPSLIGGFEGPLSFKISAVDPTTWSSTGDPVDVRLAFHEQHRRIVVPPGQPAPAEITLSVTTMPRNDPTTVLATNDTTISLPATACSSF